MRMGNEVCVDPLKQRLSGIEGSWGDAGDTWDGSWMVLEDDMRGARQWPATQGMATG